MPFHADVNDFGVVVIGAGLGLHLIHGERCLVASRSEGTCSSLAWFSSVWRSRSIHFR